MAEFNNRLKEAFRFSGRSQQDLADYMQINKSVVSTWMGGRNTPNTAEKMVKVAKFLNVSPAWLAGFDVPMENFKLDDEELKLLKKLQMLNKEGRKKTEGYIDDLLESPKYRADTEPLQKTKIA